MSETKQKKKTVKNLAAADEVMKEILTLCSIPSPTGMTGEISAYLMKRLKDLGFEPWERQKGGVFCELSASGRRSEARPDDRALLLSAHIDTLGLMIRMIKPDGRLRLSLVGGYPMNYAEQENVLVHTRDGQRYEGTVHLLNAAVHANREAGDTKRDDSTMEVVLDEEVHNREDVEALGIAVGDFISLESRARLAGSGFLKSRHLDDKASSAMLLHLAEEVAAGKIVPARKIYILFTNYEEIGHGAAGGFPEGISDMLAVDMGVVGDDLDTDEYKVSICAKDSSGPYNYDFTNHLIRLAKKLKLDYAVDIYPFYGSDCSAALHSGLDLRHALVGTGVAFSHGYERIHRKGVAQTLSLLEELLRSAEA